MRNLCSCGRRSLNEQGGTFVKDLLVLGLQLPEIFESLQLVLELEASIVIMVQLQLFERLADAFQTRFVGRLVLLLQVQEVLEVVAIHSLKTF